MSEYRYVHSAAHKTKTSYALICNLKDIHTNESKLQILDPVKRPFYVTKDEFKTHNRKKDFETLNKLDMYVTEQHNIKEAAAKALGIYHRGYIRSEEVFNSPYLYAADIDPKIWLKHKLNLNKETVALKFNIGTLDIEKSVCGDNQINLITYINGDGQCYTAILKSFLKDKTLDDVKKSLKNKWRQFKGDLNDNAKKLFDKISFKFNFHVTDKELDLIEWTFKNIHFHKPDFCCIWNMGYDIPQIIDRVKFRGKRPEDVLCHPEVPRKYRVCNYYQDTKDYSHWTYKWDWFTLSGYTQFIDSMCLFSLLRKAKGIKNSYGLDAIAGELLGTGKVKFGQDKTHYVMQTSDFVNYTVYNIFDTILVLLLDKLTKDAEVMNILSSTSLLSDFNKQSVQLKNDFFAYCRDNGAICASSIGSQKKEEDDEITKVGGNVLSPLLTRNIGIPVIDEIPSQMSMLLKFVIDLDVSLIWRPVSVMMHGKPFQLLEPPKAHMLQYT